MSRIISESYCRQYKHVINILKTAINRCPNELWYRKRTKTSFMPAEIAYHSIPWFGIINKPEYPDSDKIPTKSEVLEMISQFSLYVEENLTKLTDENILNSKREDSRIGIKQLIYSLRHSQYNTGMFVQILKENGIKSPIWGTGNRQ